MDPDGNAAWTASMWWLTVADGPLPVGDIIYGIGVTAELIGLAYVANKYSTKTCDVAIPQTQSKAKEQTQESNAIRFQLQTGSDTPASAVRVSNDKLGVKKQEAYGALAELYSTAIAKEPGLAKCKDFTSAIVRMSEAITSTPGIATGGNVMREKFSYQGKEYRIDLENLRGINLVE
jgi:hypothetical protein